MKKAFALLGPTASGKSALAMKFAAKLPVEIISIDSAQVYRGMDIGTAKPSAAERRSVAHHLIDILDPTERYSAGRFRDDAVRIAQDVLARGKTPLLVGGTMLYYRALAEGLDDVPPADPDIRLEIDREAARKGWPALHAELAKLDPRTAARLNAADAQRIQRALEVHRSTGKLLSDFQSGKKPALPFDLRAFALIPPDRAELHQRIAERFDAMLRAGLVEELKILKSKFDLSAELPSMRCVGYRQAWEFLDGALDAKALREKAVAATRQLAKRQLTWLRSLPGIEPAARLADALGRAS
ncbi:MAG TPA: tRNA (adenosine(37)-N6)-dimethylallyltransferase MiaA [Burkholderiales bacterium]|nr:tRNA (adenosine(37)-N6)-dimethylallyltransferase MiaA [Burkholderiales bacterium]